MLEVRCKIISVRVLSSCLCILSCNCVPDRKLSAVNSSLFFDAVAFDCALIWQIDFLFFVFFPPLFFFFFEKRFLLKGNAGENRNTQVTVSSSIAHYLIVSFSSY